MIKRYLLLGLGAGHGGSLIIPLWLVFLGPVLLGFQILMRRKNFGSFVSSLSLPRFAMVYGFFWALAISMLPLGYRPFIYFQF